MPLLQATDLDVSYPGRPGVLDGASLSIERAEIVGLSGPSGCGKTTLALALLGLLPESTVVSGSIRFDGRELRTMQERERQGIRGARIGLVFQESALALHPLLTAGAQIAEVVRSHERCSRADAHERAHAVLKDVGFDRERTRVFGAYPHELSGGQRQRILLAQAIVCRPALVIADEPVASLDDATRADVLALIRTLSERAGTAFLLVTHNADVLARTAHRVLEMRAGRVCAAGRPARPSIAVTSRPARPGAPFGHDPVIQVVGVSRTYDRRTLLSRTRPAVRALDDVHLTIPRGATLGLAGRSGCGKSTLARCMAALEPPDSGEVRIDGTDVAGLRGRALLPFRNQVQVIFQDSAAALNPRFTALDVIAEPLVVQQAGTAPERRARAADLMAAVGLSADRLQSRPHEFSGGERQRLAIARALAVHPAVLILDEAFSGLDLVTRERIVRLLADLQSAHGLTYVCISHDLDLLASFATDVIVMDEGRIAPRAAACLPEGAVA